MSCVVLNLSSALCLCLVHKLHYATPCPSTLDYYLSTEDHALLFWLCSEHKDLSHFVFLFVNTTVPVVLENLCKRIATLIHPLYQASHNPNSIHHTTHE